MLAAAGCVEARAADAGVKELEPTRLMGTFKSEVNLDSALPYIPKAIVAPAASSGIELETATSLVKPDAAAPSQPPYSEAPASHNQNKSLDHP